MTVRLGPDVIAMSAAHVDVETTFAFELPSANEAYGHATWGEWRDKGANK